MTGQWQPMDTAPKDGSSILVTRESGSMCVASWDDFKYSDGSVGGVERLSELPRNTNLLDATAGATQMLDQAYAEALKRIAQLQTDYNSSQQTVRELEQVVKHCNPAEGDGELCYYCGRPTSDVAANPGMWSIALCHADDPGVVKWHHTSCVTDRICERDALQQTMRELRAKLEEASSAQEYKDAINGCLAATIKQNPSLDHKWGGDRTGWGFVFEWVKWVGPRAVAAEAQRDELRSQLAKRTFERDDASQSCDVMQAERDRALSELADARRDTERVDWLDKHHIEQSNPPQSPGLYRGLTQYKKVGIDCRQNLTLREAIDDARAATDAAKNQ